MKPEYRSYYKILAISRTRIFTNITFPALIGGAYAYSTGHFGISRFVLILLGLIFTELYNLMSYDKEALKKENSGKIKFIPGNPVFSPMSLTREKLPQMITVSIVGFLLVLVYFVLVSGWSIAALMILSVVIGRVSIKNMFPYSSLLISLLPPLYSGIVYFALSGMADQQAFLIALPATWIMAGTMLIYYEMYKDKTGYRDNLYFPVILLYIISFFNIIYNTNTDLYHPVALLSVLLYIWPMRKFALLAKSETEDPVPATSLGYILHASVLLLLAVSVLIN